MLVLDVSSLGPSSEVRAKMGVKAKDSCLTPIKGKTNSNNLAYWLVIALVMGAVIVLKVYGWH